jgi:hypothetical protein
MTCFSKEYWQDSRWLLQRRSFAVETVLREGVVVRPSAGISILGVRAEEDPWVGVPDLSQWRKFETHLANSTCSLESTSASIPWLVGITDFVAHIYHGGATSYCVVSECSCSCGEYTGLVAILPASRLVELEETSKGVQLVSPWLRVVPDLD